MRYLVAFFIVAALSGILAPPAAAQDQQRVEHGMKVVADSRCTLCHSIEGKGNAKGVLDGVGSKLTADEIREWLVNPQKMNEQLKSSRKPPMKSFASMPKGDLDAVVAYLLTLKAK